VLKQLSGKLGENMLVPKIARFENRAGRVGAYVHHNDKIGALLSVSAPAASPDEVTGFVKTLGMHVAANRPLALRRDDVPAELAERERQVYAQSEEVLKKPEDKRERIVGGMMEKFFSGAALLEQPWVLDPDTSVEKALQKALGKDARVEAFALFVVGG
jgi:elongation factor Ts